MHSSGGILLGGGFVLDSLEPGDSLAVVAAIAGWALVITGALHLSVALGRVAQGALRGLAVASGAALIVLVVSDWTFASF